MVAPRLWWPNLAEVPAAGLRFDGPVEDGFDRVLDLAFGDGCWMRAKLCLLQQVTNFGRDLGGKRLIVCDIGIFMVVTLAALCAST